MVVAELVVVIVETFLTVWKVVVNVIMNNVVKLVAQKKKCALAKPAADQIAMERLVVMMDVVEFVAIVKPMRVVSKVTAPAL